MRAFAVCAAVSLRWSAASLSSALLLSPTCFFRSITFFLSKNTDGRNGSNQDGHFAYARVVMMMRGTIMIGVMIMILVLVKVTWITFYVCFEGRHSLALFLGLGVQQCNLFFEGSDGFLVDFFEVLHFVGRPSELFRQRQNLFVFSADLSQVQPLQHQSS